jgi:hypothetical protein
MASVKKKPLRCGRERSGSSGSSTGMRIAPDVAVQWKQPRRLSYEDSADTRVKHDAMTRADTILEQLGVATFAYLSDWSPTGFHQRLVRLAAALLEALARGSSDALWLQFQAVSRHQAAVGHVEQVRRAEMAVRLVRWLSTPPTPPGESLGSAANKYTQSSSLVDLARIALRAGDAVQPLADAYAALLSHVAERREEENLRFGELLTDWIATGSTSGDLLPVEDTIERVIGPLAAEVPVLLSSLTE